MSLENILTITLTLFAVINMLGNIPLVIKLRKDFGEINSLKSSIISSGIMILSLFVGKTLFSLLGIDVTHFAIAGSLLLMYFGSKMVLGIEDGNKAKKAKSATVFPISFPLIAGPGTLSTIISFRAEFSDWEIITGIIVNALIIFIVLKLSTKINKVLGNSGIELMERLFGILLISIAIKMFINNLILSINEFNLAIFQ